MCLCHNSLSLATYCPEVAFETTQNPASTGGRLLQKALKEVLIEE